MKRVLLTGATGFIGRHCLPSLLAKGYEVHAAARSIDRVSRTKALSEVRWHQTNLLDAGQAARLMEEVSPSHLLHLAWYAVPGKFWTATENFAWVSASLNLLEQFARRGGERMVMAGSCAEYDWTYGHCSEGRTPLQPATLYGACKRALNLMLDAYAAHTGVSSAWGRIFFLYGAHEHAQRLVSSVINHLLKGERAPCSHGTQMRDFLYVQDVADAFVALLESEVLGAVNIASGEAVMLKDVVGKIADKFDRRSLVDFGAVPVSPTEPPLLVAEVERLNNEVGWRPKFTLDEGLEQTIEWWKEFSGIYPSK